MFGEPVTNVGKYSFDTVCDCGCSILHMEREEDFLCVQLYVDSFGTAQDGPMKILWHRIKCAWLILSGKECLFYNLLVHNDNVPSFKAAFEKVLKPKIVFKEIK